MNLFNIFLSYFLFHLDIFDAKQACEHLTGFNVGGRYLTVLYYQPKNATKIDTNKETKDINILKKIVETNDELIKQETNKNSNSEDSLELDEDERDRKYAIRR